MPTTIQTSQKKCSDSYGTILKNSVEYALCADSPALFLQRYAHIQNQNEAKKVKWEPWQYQIDLLTLFRQYPEIIILKARQLGISWLVSGYADWTANFKDDARVLMLSYKENEAFELLSKARYIYESLPDFLRRPLDNMSRGWLSFKDWHSEIKTFPSTSEAGIGYNATLVIRDELARHPFGKENYANISPTIDSGGQIIDLSTIDKSNPDNHFTERIRRALKGSEKHVLSSGIEYYTGGESKACLIFLGWKLRPTRIDGMSVEEWFETRIIHKYEPMQIEEQYPSSLDEALRPSAITAFFDFKALNDMMLQVDTPLRNFNDFDTYNGMVRVYKPPVLGRIYAVFTDPSNGIADPFVTIVMDARTGEGVCTAVGNIPAQEVARIHDTLVRAYNNAYNTGEVNAMAGGSFIDTLKTLETPNIVPRRLPDGKIAPNKIGWYSTKPMRDNSLHELKEAVRKQLITIHDREAVEELRFFQQTESGKLEAPGHKHDDWVMAWAGAWMISRYIPLSDIRITSSKYKV